jgi:hypothetical protein
MRRKTPKIKVSVIYEYAYGPDQEAAISVLAEMIDIVRTRSLKKSSPPSSNSPFQSDAQEKGIENK